MFIPEGMTEPEVIEIIYRVSRSVSGKYLFGYNSLDDMIQQGVQIAITILNNGKFKPRGDKPMAKQLTNFLYVWINNRLNNYRRDHSCRYPNVDKEPNRSKYNIMHPLKIHSMGMEHSDIFAFSENVIDKLDDKHMMEKLLTSMSSYKRNLWLKMVAGEALPVKKQKMMVKHIKKTLSKEFASEEACDS